MKYNTTNGQAVLNEVSNVFDSFDKHLVLGSEEFDRFGTLPWSNWNGPVALKAVQDRLRSPRFDVVVNFRAPRQAHWMSIYKQLNLLDSRANLSTRSYEEMICEASEREWEYLDSVSNPLGEVDAMLDVLSPETRFVLVDLAGVAAQQLDVSHVIACKVLRVPCTDNETWVKGLPHEEHHKNRSTDRSTLPRELLDEVEIEWLFRQRDCLYRHRLKDHERVTILYNHTIWEYCSMSDDELIP